MLRNAESHPPHSRGWCTRFADWQTLMRPQQLAQAWSDVTLGEVEKMCNEGLVSLSRKHIGRIAEDVGTRWELCSNEV